MIRTIIFDFGNVVAFFDHERAMVQLQSFTKVPTKELVQRLYNSPIEDAYERGQTTTEEYVAAAKLAGQIDCTDEVFLAAFVDIFWANDEVCSLIPRLAGRYRLVLASNTNQAHFGKFSQQFAAVLRYFDFLVTSFEARARKPEPAYFAYAQQHVDALPDECLFIDDLSANVKAAQQHGWRGITYQSPGTLPRQLRAQGIEIPGDYS